MSDVKRWISFGEGVYRIKDANALGNDIFEYNWECGELVLASDFARMQRERDEAVAVITALRAEVERLTSELDRIIKRPPTAAAAIQHAALLEAIGQRDALRAALERIAKTATDVGSELSMTDDEWRDYWSDKCGVHWDIAREALRGPDRS